MQNSKRFIIILTTICFLCGSFITTVIFLALSNREPKLQEIPDLFDSKLIVFDNMKAVSPNGKYIAFVTAKNLGMKSGSVWISNFDGSNAHVLASTIPEYTFATNPIWSPDSKKIVYLRFYPTQLWIVNKDGSDNRMISDSKLLYIPYGYGGSSNLKWNDTNEIEFLNSAKYPSMKYAANIDTGAIREIGQEGYTKSIVEKIDLVSQHDQKWDSIELGTCAGKTIGSHGCAISDIAMIFQYYGINANSEDLNSMLLDNQGYMNGCDVRWDIAVNFAKGLKFMAIYHHDATWERLNFEIDSGHPVIVGMDKYNHFVVVTHREGDKYFIMDPREKDSTKVKTLADYDNILDHMVIYYKD